MKAYEAEYDRLHQAQYDLLYEMYKSGVVSRSELLNGNLFQPLEDPPSEEELLESVSLLRQLAGR